MNDRRTITVLAELQPFLYIDKIDSRTVHARRLAAIFDVNPLVSWLPAWRLVFLGLCIFLAQSKTLHILLDTISPSLPRRCCTCWFIFVGSGMSEFGLVSNICASSWCCSKVDRGDVAVACCWILWWNCAPVWLEPCWNDTEAASACFVNNCCLFLRWW